MKKIYWLIFVCFLSLFSCSDKDDNHYNVEDLDINMYVNDSIDLSKYSSDLNENCQFSKENNLFGLYKGKLYVKDLSNIRQKQTYELVVNNHNIKVGVTFWIEDKYSLELIDSDCKYRVLLTKADTTFFIENSKLYYSVGNMNNKIFCSNLPYDDVLYTEMIETDNMYAYRTGGKILVSKDLKNWKMIYSNKRGIKSSMIILEEKKRLLFIEYTPGGVRDRHHIYSYSFDTNKLDIKYTFYGSNEELGDPSLKQVRHIHVIAKDPYTNDIYVGTGDADDESIVLKSQDGGDNFQIIGSGSQIWRVLSFIFTPTDVFWNTDSEAPQFLTRMSKKDPNELVRFPLTNSALWCIMDYNLDSNTKMIIMSSNNEGGIYDNYSRTYGILVENRIPIVYELYKIKASIQYTQLFPLGVDNEGKVYLCDVQNLKISIFNLKQ